MDSLRQLSIGTVDEKALAHPDVFKQMVGVVMQLYRIPPREPLNPKKKRSNNDLAVILPRDTDGSADGPSLLKRMRDSPSEGEPTPSSSFTKKRKDNDKKENSAVGSKEKGKAEVNPTGTESAASGADGQKDKDEGLQIEDVLERSLWPLMDNHLSRLAARCF